MLFTGGSPCGRCDVCGRGVTAANPSIRDLTARNKYNVRGFRISVPGLPCPGGHWMALLVYVFALKGTAGTTLAWHHRPSSIPKDFFLGASSLQGLPPF